jgi:uncharacterized protein with HEPN domain
MSRRNPDVALRQMLDHAREAMILSKGKSALDIVDDRMLSLAIVRLMEIVGEAANRIPLEERSMHPEIPWTQIASLRNRLINAYDAIDYDILWQILNHDLPELVFSLERILGLKFEQLADKGSQSATMLKP